MADRNIFQGIAVIPPIQGSFKSLPEGGARITFELPPGDAQLLYSFIEVTKAQAQKEGKAGVLYQLSIEVRE